MAAQGFSPLDFLWSEDSYNLYCNLAGNAMTTPVVGSVVLALVMCVFLQQDPPLKWLAVIGMQWLSCGVEQRRRIFCHRHFCPRQVDEAQGGSGHQEEDQSCDCTTQMIYISALIVSSLFSRVQTLIDYCSIPSHTDFSWLPLPLVHRSRIGIFMKSKR